MSDIHKERNLAVAERLVGMSVYCLREARGLAGEVKVPLRLVHEIEVIAQELYEASETSWDGERGA
jgi:hypothetical protein